ncbi:unnamed protein product, partial [Larinioides sclopetarius]
TSSTHIHFKLIGSALCTRNGAVDLPNSCSDAISINKMRLRTRYERNFEEFVVGLILLQYQRTENISTLTCSYIDIFTGNGANNVSCDTSIYC